MAVAVITSFDQICDQNGVPVSGGTVTVQDANTTTPRACYTDTGLSISATNPIPLNSSGRHTQGMVYISAAAYKVIVKDADGTTLFTRDNIDPGVPIGTGALAIANGGTGATSAAAALAALGGASTAEVADLASDVAGLVGATASSEKTHIATGTTGQRPAVPVEGDIRRNTTTSRWEGYNQSSAYELFLTDTEIASSAEALAGSDNTKVMTPAKVRAASAFQSALLHVREQQSAGTGGGTFTNGAWRTRVLNTSVTNEITGASLGSNQITLPSGTYYIEADAPGSGCNGHVAKLRNTTDAADTLIGTAEFASGTSTTRSFVRGRFTIAAQKVFELQHQCGTTVSTVGLGTAVNVGVVEVYSTVRIWKVA